MLRIGHQCAAQVAQLDLEHRRDQVARCIRLQSIGGRLGLGAAADAALEAATETVAVGAFSSQHNVARLDVGVQQAVQVQVSQPG